MFNKISTKYLELMILLLHASINTCSVCESHYQKRNIEISPDDIKQLNDYIYSLKYNRDNLLTYLGGSVKNDPRKRCYLDEDKSFVTISKERKTITSEKADIGILSINEHRTYPGSLLLANRRLVANVPDILSVERSCIKYTVNLPDLEHDGSFKIIPSFANYKASLNRIVNKWYDKFSRSKKSWEKINELFTDGHILAFSKDQLRVKFGTEFQNTLIESDIDFDAISREEKLVMVQRFKRIFYRVTVESPKRPADVFGKGVTVEELTGKIDKKNPPVLIDSVSYGRVIYLKIETSSTDLEARNIIEFKLHKIFGNNKVSITKKNLHDISKLKNLNLHIYVMGPGNEQLQILSLKSLSQINEIITNYTSFNQSNFGYPISYTCEFLKDNTRVFIKSISDYLEIATTINKKGVIKLIHYGLFIAKWNVEWDELSYDSRGNEVLDHKTWYKNDQALTLPFSEEIELNGNCRNLSVSAKEFTGFFWEWWRSIFDRKNIPLIGFRKFKITGTTFTPCYKIKPPL